MGYDPIQCTRAYLTLWKLVDGLFPESKWLEIGAVPYSELRANAEKMQSDSLNWCDNVDKLRDYADEVLALPDELGQDITIRAGQLRSELRDLALKYAFTIAPSSEWKGDTLSWELLKKEEGG